jgi:hypothetical protein
MSRFPPHAGVDLRNINSASANPANELKFKTGHCTFQTGPLGIETGQYPIMAGLLTGKRTVRGGYLEACQNLLVTDPVNAARFTTAASTW